MCCVWVGCVAFDDLSFVALACSWWYLCLIGAGLFADVACLVVFIACVGCCCDAVCIGGVCYLVGYIVL